MRIKFKAPDPRAGMVVQMDSRRGQEFVEAGSADIVKEDGSQDAAPAIDAASAPVVTSVEAGAAVKPGKTTKKKA
jgi:hypothetical protein